MAVLVLFSGAPQVPEGDTYPCYPYGFTFGVGEAMTFDAALAEQCGRPADNDGADFAELFCAAENLHLDRRNRMDPKPFTVQPMPEEQPTAPTSPPSEKAKTANTPPADGQKGS